MARILISAGEASGDIHAAAVTAAIKKIDPSAEVFGMGGDALRNSGGDHDRRDSWRRRGCGQLRSRDQRPSGKPGG